MKSRTTARFRTAYANLPGQVQRQARAAYRLFLRNPFHPGLRFKRVHSTKPIYAVRISRDYRALGIRNQNEMVWFWIGSHAKYEKILSRSV